MRAKPVTAAIKSGKLRMFKWVNMSNDTGYFGWATYVMLLTLIACPSLVYAQGDLPVLVESKQATFLSGKKLDRKILQEFSVWWRDGELRDRLMAFSNSEKIAIMLDRRVDPSTLMNVGIEKRTVEQIFWRVSEAAEIGVCRIEDCYYFGPVDTVVALSLIHI